MTIGLKITAFVKAMKVVESCKTREHLSVAKQYVKMVRESYCLSEKMCDRLQDKLQEIAKLLA